MRRALVVALAAAALVACSDDDGSGESTSTTRVGVLGALLDDDCAFLVEGAFMDPGSLITDDGRFDFEANAQRYDDLAEAGPEELRDDLGVIAERMHEVASAFAEVDPADRVGERFLAAMEVFADAFDADYRRAATAVFRYTTEHCTDGR